MAYETWVRCVSVHIVVSVITCLITIVIFRTVRTFIAADVLTFCDFLHLPREAFLGAFRLNLLQREKKSQIVFFFFFPKIHPKKKVYPVFDLKDLFTKQYFGLFFS